MISFFSSLYVLGRRKIFLGISIFFISLLFMFSFSVLILCVTIRCRLRDLVLLRAAFGESFGAAFVCGFSIGPFLVVNSLGDSQLVRFPKILIQRD